MDLRLYFAFPNIPREFSFVNLALKIYSDNEKKDDQEHCKNNAVCEYF